MILTLLTISFLVPLTVAQTDSLIWENIPEGVYLNDWVENSPDEWEPYNDSGIGVVNFSGNVWGYILNDSVAGHRWYQTFEVQSDMDGEFVVSAIMSVMSSNISEDNTNFYAMIYYLFDPLYPLDPHAGLYMIRYVAGTPYYYNESAEDKWDTNMSNATSYCQAEADYYSSFCRVKALWNFYDEIEEDFSARFKIWDASGDEPDTWMLDSEFSSYEIGATNSNMWYSGIGADNELCPGNLVQFRRIAMWNLSYDLYDDNVAYIGVPQYDATTLFEDMDEMSEVDDYWNYTSMFVDMINSWDLTSFYNENNISEIGAQNDTVYVFSVMTTGWEDFFDEHFAEEWWEDWGDAVFPNNILVIHAYNPTDGTADGDPIEWDDFCRLRFDFNNDGYDANDYMFEVDGTDTLFGYWGFTQVIPDSPDEWYGEGYYDYIDDDSWGNMFRDYEYPNYAFFLNWDLISGGIDVNTPVNISISFLDNESDDYSIWQDWDELDEITPRWESDNETWQSSNTTTLWGIMEILGDPLDFDDPEEPSADEPAHLLKNAEGVNPALVILLTIVILLWGAYNVWNLFTGTKKITIQSIKDQLIVVVILVVVIVVIVSLI